LLCATSRRPLRIRNFAAVAFRTSRLSGSNQSAENNSCDMAMSAASSWSGSRSRNTHVGDNDQLPWSRVYALSRREKIRILPHLYCLDMPPHGPTSYRTNRANMCNQTNAIAQRDHQAIHHLRGSACHVLDGSPQP
jgi:hypothetical protein